MKFFICPASASQLEDGVFDLFQSKNGTAYHYQVDYIEDEMITIKDTVGRIVPLDITEIPALIQVLLRIDEFQENKAYFQKKLATTLVAGMVNV